MQEQYGRDGLEIVGIAYESGDPAQKVNRVRQFRARFTPHINYSLLMGGGSSGRCPVLTQFQVTGLPTLVLLDENGKILKYILGEDEESLKELDVIIRNRLRP